MFNINDINKQDLVYIIEQSCIKWNYKFFTSGNYNLNIIGIRNSNRDSNIFDDYICLLYKVDSNWVTKIYPATTNPGKTYLKDPMSNKGCAILVPYQYSGCYTIGLHKNSYTALVQTKGKVAVYRDNNKDSILDYDPRTIEAGYFGINIHRSSSTGTSTYIDNWSAGCQVFANINNYNEFIKLCKVSADRYGSKFTYTLFDERQLI